MFNTRLLHKLSYIVYILQNSVQTTAIHLSILFVLVDGEKQPHM